ncbi:MAG: hypothetical protein J6B75_01130 [Ruminococcus sp.]|nr:hypothetical protein [Ruminococcus sp.]
MSEFVDKKETAHCWVVFDYIPLRIDLIHVLSSQRIISSEPNAINKGLSATRTQ